jgi:N1-aminopropylagmatine ureohydrolase
MPGFLDIPNELSEASTAKVHIIPIPYDQTSTYRKGADLGPQAILEASTHIEWYDIETESEPHCYGIHTQDPVECLDPDPINLAPLVRSRVTAALKTGKLPVILGGEHSVSIGAIEAAANLTNQLSILQIDAHGDTRESYMGSTNNHACVMARARELGSVVQIGIRSIDKSELAGMDLERVYFAHQINEATRLNDHTWMDRVVAQLDEKVYLTIDLDGFDPSLIPSTGTPEPGGLDWSTVNKLISLVAKRKTIIGFDVVELCPNESHHASDFIAAKLVFRVIAEILSAQSSKLTDS